MSLIQKLNIVYWKFTCDLEYRLNDCAFLWGILYIVGSDKWYGVAWKDNENNEE